MGFRRIDDLPVEGRKVFVRVDFNVPFDADGNITDDTRIQAALPTVKELTERGARVILASHLGRPKGQVVESLRMAPVAQRLGELLGKPVTALHECVGDAARSACEAAAKGDVVVLENVRFHAGETKGDPEFSRSLAEHADLFVNDAFGTSHRAHCSVVGVAAALPAEARAAGRLMERELSALGNILQEPARPFAAILGGAKVSDKITVVNNLLDVVDVLVVGGGMAYTFLKAQGHAVGASKLEADRIDVAKAALDKAAAKGAQLLLPEDHVIASEFSESAAAEVTDGIEIPDGKMALDIGPRSRAKFESALQEAKSIVWNGPVGVFEWDRFAEGTLSLAKCVAASSATTVVGGGDSLAVIKKYGLQGKFSHVSTGGGAFLEMMEGKDLPGVAILQS